MIYKTTISRFRQAKAVDLLADLSGLSKTKVKMAMSCGAVWHRRPGRKETRLRRAATRLRAGDTIAMYFDMQILQQTTPPARCMKDFQHYSVWYKPAGMVTQGTRFGDHCALLRQVEQQFRPRRSALPVHRIDREASGLVLVAHHRRAAAELSAMLRGHEIEKIYQIRVPGDLGGYRTEGTIDSDLDGREAITRFRLLKFDPRREESLVEVSLLTGRRHQIRRHFAMIGYPLLGDPRYGHGNKNREGLQLSATSLVFDCPFGNGTVKLQIEPESLLR